MVEEFQVGVITQTHGVRGEVKVFPTTDEPSRFKKLKNVTLDTGKKRLELEIENVKFFKQFVILKFKGYDDINLVEGFKTGRLLVDREHAVRLRRNEYFVADLIGMNVISDDEKFSGVLKNVISTGANDVYEIELSDGRMLLLPAIRECILDVEPESQQMLIHILDGLLED